VLDAGAAPDPADFLPKWQTLAANAAGTRHVIMGHGFSRDAGGATVTTMTFETVVWRYNYLRRLWEAVSRARAAGRSLDDVKADLAIERAFPDLKDKRRAITGRDGAPADAHEHNIEMMGNALDRQTRCGAPRRNG